MVGRALTPAREVGPGYAPPMLLTVATTHRPATDLGFLLAKNPARSHAADLPFGRASVFFPTAGPERCEAALLVELDPLWGGARPEDGPPLGRFVNDRGSAASALLSLAMTRVFGSAMAGRSRERPDLARAALPLEATVVALRCRGGEAVARRLFEPLGWSVALAPVAVPEATARAVPTFDLTVRGVGLLADLLTHLAVLVPALDDRTPEGLAEEEVESLLAHGGAWLAAHPERALIAERYRPARPDPGRAALARLVAGEAPPPEALPAVGPPEEALEAALSLAELRSDAALRWLRDREARTVADVGCGDGRLLRRLAREPSLKRVIGVEVSASALGRARRRVGPDEIGERAAAKVELLQGSATYADDRLTDLDALLLLEVVEHLDPERLPALEDAVFAVARPRTVVVTTPNAEYDARLPPRPPGALRSRDHRFEWTRAELRAWAEGVAARRGYAVRFEDLGPIDDALGGPTQLAAFLR